MQRVRNDFLNALSLRRVRTESNAPLRVPLTLSQCAPPQCTLPPNDVDEQPDNTKHDGDVREVEIGPVITGPKRHMKKVDDFTGSEPQAGQAIRHVPQRSPCDQPQRDGDTAIVGSQLRELPKGYYNRE